VVGKKRDREGRADKRKEFVEGMKYNGMREE
jgi:hypothetical protein